MSERKGGRKWELTGTHSTPHNLILCTPVIAFEEVGTSSGCGLMMMPLALLSSWSVAPVIVLGGGGTLAESELARRWSNVQKHLPSLGEWTRTKGHSQFREEGRKPQTRTYRLA
jgi:hypothetical protein